MKRVVKNVKVSRKKVLITAGALAVIILAVYGGLSVWAWSQYKGIYGNWQSDIKTKLDLAINMPITTTEQKTKWLNALDSASNAAAESNKCSPGTLYSWQQVVIPTLKSEVTDCKRAQGAMNNLYKSLETMIKSVRADTTIAVILGEPLKVTTVSEAAYQGEVDAWSKAAASVRAIDAPSEAAGVKTAAISASEAIKTAWSALLTANTVQNASQYQAALNSLTGAYSTLNTVSNESKKSLQTVADAVQKAYGDAF